MARPLEDLVDWLGRDNEFPDGVILLTGTGVVPPDDFTLPAGDVVSITIDGIGTLTNPVVVGGLSDVRRGSRCRRDGVFLRHFARSFLIAQLVVLVSLVIGMLGYHGIEGMAWDDAFVNAAMILSGMGPMGELKTTAGKIFAGCYALYSGLALIVIIGIMIGPVVHRFLHRFHLEGRKHE